MRSTFFGLELGWRALQAEQRAIDVTGHNVANANTPGYSRQELIVAPSDPYTVPSSVRPGGMAGQVGTGVKEVEIRRYRDAFLDRQYQVENSTLGQWETRQQVLSQVEGIFNEPSDSSIRSVLDQFWNSLQDLANQPENSATRANVRQRASDVAQTIRHTYQLITNLRNNLDFDLRNKVSEVNETAREIASINQLVVASTAVGDQPNDLRDHRTLLLDNLSKLGDFTSVEDSRGQVDVYLNGVAIVEGTDVHKLMTVDNAGNGGLADVYWSHLNAPAVITSGDMGALLQLRDGDLSNYLQGLDNLATNLIAGFNAQHRAGFGLDGSTNNDLFVPGGTAQNIDISPTLSDLNKIAAGATTAPGDGQNALALAGVKDLPLISGKSLSQYFMSIVSGLGVDSQAAERSTLNQTLLVKTIDGQRESASGVSLDEEMTNMIRYQQGYNAAARLITTMDEMVRTVIEQLGR